jgi:hypothetical protein
MCVFSLVVDALNAFLPLERLHFLCYFDLGRLSGIILGLIIVVIVSLLVASGLLFLSDRLVASLSCCLFSLKSGIKTLLVIVVDVFITAVVSDNLASFVLFELLRVEVAIVPISLGEVILCNNAEIIADKQGFELLSTRLLLILALILNDDFIINEADRGPPMVLQT